ncbi:MAG: hypothetical protein J6S43_05630 [Lentisphaeria bacterium]|nr:hypothetical protein [Lentisphaeria bacterium]
MMKIERSVTQQRTLDRFGRCERARICYVASGVDMEQVDKAVVEVFAAAPDKWEGVPKVSAGILRSAGGILEVGVDYRRTVNTLPADSGSHRAGDREWRVEVNAGTEYSRQALACIFSQTTEPGKPLPDPGRMIDWNGKRGLASTSGQIVRYTPEMSLCCIATFPRERAFSRAYLRQIANLVGKVNSGVFFNWNPGEVLFLGLTGSRSFTGEDGKALCDLTFRFNIRCSSRRIVGGVDAGLVDGWDHLWTIPADTPEYDGIYSVHVSRIYERASFAVLDL